MATYATILQAAESPSRHQFDYDFYFPNLRAVKNTAASWDWGKTAAVGGNRCGEAEGFTAGGRALLGS